MRIHQARFITACQQLLALGVVLAVLTPAANIVNLDVVAQEPANSPAAGGSAVLSSAEVPAEPVDPEVTEYAFDVDATSPVPVPETQTGQGPGAGLAADSSQEALAAVASAPVEGFGAVGVTWSPESAVSEDALSVEVRTREGQEWSDWAPLEFHDDHAPEPGSPDAATARPGTDPMIVGDVDEVQVRAGGEEELPSDLSLAVVDPGVADLTHDEAPELATETPEEPAEGTVAGSAEDGIVLQAARRKAAAQPTIFSRAQWGADERIRNKSSLRYGTISAGFVHHTVNANDYTADQVPGIIRSIYAYHVKSRGWSDIGYNFLVDRFGRIWEGRYGGIDKAVVGAHTLGYNDYSFAMSAIGNFDLVQPSAEVLAAYGQLFAWKLGLHGVDPASTSQKVGRKVFPAINGHRDAGSTACPGKFLYAQLPAIRSAAAAASAAPAPPATPAPPAPPAAPVYHEAKLNSNLVGSEHPDIVVRRASDGRGFVLPTGGLGAFTRTQTVFKSGWKKAADVVASPDLTGDGVADLVVTSRPGIGKVRPGNGNGGFKRASRTVKSMRGTTMLTAVGDIDADGRNDLVAKVKKSREAVAFLGTAKNGFKKVRLGRTWGRYSKLIGVGDINTDGRPDLLGRDKKGQLWTRFGTGSASFSGARKTPGSWSSYNQLMGGADFTGDGRPDLAARQRNGKVYILPGRGDGTFGQALGPMVNIPKLSGLTAAQVVGSPAPDLVARKGAALVVVPNRGTFDLGQPIDTGVDLSGSNLLLNAGDWDRDGHGDVLTRENDGNLLLRRGNGQGQFAAPVVLGNGWPAGESLEAVGDVTGDGFPDLMRTPNGGQPLLYSGRGTANVLPPVPATGLAGAAARLASRTSPSYDLSGYDWRIPIADAQLGPRTDLVAREASTGNLYLINGSAKGLTGRRLLGEGLGAYDLAG